MFGFMKKTPAEPEAHPDEEKKYTAPTKAEKKNFENDFKDSGGMENQSVEELENYAAYKSEETTKSVDNCRRIAEDIRGDASKTLETLHEQGEQIHRTHETAVTIDQDLSKGEKLLNSLGGMFSKPWKPKKTREITGPLSEPEKKPKKASKEQKDKLMSSDKKGGKNNAPEPTTAMQKVELEKQKQDEGLDDLSDILGDLKGMATDMGTELDRQNKALDHLDKDVDELNSRVKGANKRAEHLLK